MNFPFLFNMLFECELSFDEINQWVNIVLNSTLRFGAKNLHLAEVSEMLNTYQNYICYNYCIEKYIYMEMSALMLILRRY